MILLAVIVVLTLITCCFELVRLLHTDGLRPQAERSARAADAAWVNGESR